MQILFVSSPSLAGAGIRAWEGGSANHVGMSFDRGTVLDATFAHKVRPWSADEWMAYQNRQLVAIYDVHLPRPADALTWAQRQFGQGYDVLGFIGFPLLRSLHDHDRDGDGAAKQYCSRYVRNALMHGGVPMATAGLPAGAQHGHTDREGRYGVRHLLNWCEGYAARSR